MKRLFNYYFSKNFRKKLRNNMTIPEQKIWYYLRNKNLNGVKFRRQVSIGKYIVDFYSFEKKLVIEIDGDSHFLDEMAIEKDRIRTAFLKSQGLTILRFTNIDVVQNLEACVDVVLKFLV